MNKLELSLAPLAFNPNTPKLDKGITMSLRPDGSYTVNFEPALSYGEILSHKNSNQNKYNNLYKVEWPPLRKLNIKNNQSTTESQQELNSRT